MFQTPCEAILAASDNDVIEIDASAPYTQNTCKLAKNGVTLRGMKGRAKLDAESTLTPDRAIWLIEGSDTTIESIEFTGARDVKATKEVAAIRQVGANLTVKDCYFHDNDSGIIVYDSAASEILVENTEFAANGVSLNTLRHNIEIGQVARFTLQYSYSHDAVYADLVSSRAAENYILYNRLSTEGTSESRFELSLPDGGRSYVVGNVIYQSATSQDYLTIAYLLDPKIPNPSDELYVINNTFVSDIPTGTIFIDASPASSAKPIIRNNIFVGATATPVLPEDALEAGNNLVTDINGSDPIDPMFADRAGLDFHIKAGSPAEDKGASPDKGGDFDLTPVKQYVHLASTEDRPIDDPIDIGAYEIPAPAPGTGGAGGEGGAGGGAGVGGQGGDTGTGGAPATTGGDATGEGGGCGCRTGAGGSPQGGALAVMGLALLYGIRRRRSR